VGVAVGIADLWTDPHHTVSHFHRRRRNVIGPQIKGAATRQVKAGVVPMAGQDAVFDRPTMQWKSQVRTAVVERKYLTAIMHDEQWTASAANDDHACSLQLLQRGHTNEVIGVLGRALADRESRHERHNRVLRII
jgi:hypothetical protein